jgi:hypothetical protein
MSTSSVIAVVGASGGLGASTLSLAVGRRLAATGPPALVVDLDVGGGGLDVTAGIEHLPGRRWPALADVRGHVDAAQLIGALPEEDRCCLLSAGGPSRGAAPARAVDDVVASLLDAGAVVLDVGRCATPPCVPATDPVVVLLTWLTTRGLADVDARLELLRSEWGASTDPDVRVITRGGRPSPEVVDDIEAHLGVPHLHHLPDDPRVPKDAERGVWPGSSRDAVRDAADVVVGAVEALRVAS